MTPHQTTEINEVSRLLDLYSRKAEGELSQQLEELSRRLGALVDPNIFGIPVVVSPYLPDGTILMQEIRDGKTWVYGVETGLEWVPLDSLKAPTAEVPPL